MRFLWVLLFFGQTLDIFAAEVINGRCFPSTEKEIILLFRDGICAGASGLSAGAQTKGFSAPESKGVDIGRGAILFDFDATDIRNEFEQVLTAWGEALTVLPGMSFIIEGHADHIGSTRYNQRLSEQRAAQVRHFLLSRYGIEPNRLLIRGYGENKPLRGTAQQQTDEDRRWNRRVEVVKLGAE